MGICWTPQHAVLQYAAKPSDGGAVKPVAGHDGAYHILLYEELEGKEAKPAPLFVDNQAATLIAKDPVTANNMKHVARRHFYVREMQELGLVRICWWHGKGNEADALTKALPKARHRSLVKNFFNLDRGLMREREEAVREAYRDPPEDVQPGGSGG